DDGGGRRGAPRPGPCRGAALPVRRRLRFAHRRVHRLLGRGRAARQRRGRSVLGRRLGGALRRNVARRRDLAARDAGRAPLPRSLPLRWRQAALVRDGAAVSERFSAVCSPGLAPFAAAELGRLGIGAKGLEFEGSARELYRASLRLRAADRLLLKLGEFPAAAFPPLAHGALRLPWERVLAPERPVAFRVSCVKSKLYHERAIAERLAAAVERRLGRASPVGKYDEN